MKRVVMLIGLCLAAVACGAGETDEAAAVFDGVKADAMRGDTW